MNRKNSIKTIIAVIAVIAVVLFLLDSIYIRHTYTVGSVYSIDYGIIELQPKELSDWIDHLKSELEGMGYKYEKDYKKAYKLHNNFLPGMADPQNCTCFLKCKDKNAESAFTLQHLPDGKLWLIYIYHATGSPLTTAPARIKKLRKTGLELPRKIPKLAILIDEYTLKGKR